MDGAIKSGMKRLNRLTHRLKPGACIGLDGVFAMQDYYAKGGFNFSHRNMRFRAEIPKDYVGSSNDGVVLLNTIPFDLVLEYDRTCFPADRSKFLKAWIAQPDSLAIGYHKKGQLGGYGVVRRCGDGCKIGPLFADDRAAAEALFTRLTEFASGGALYLDAPENNKAAMDLVTQHQMVKVFGCARMYYGQPPKISNDRIFGVTTFEIG